MLCISLQQGGMVLLPFLDVRKVPVTVLSEMECSMCCYEVEDFRAGVPVFRVSFSLSSDR